jgi:hypothetical protein
MRFFPAIFLALVFPNVWVTLRLSRSTLPSQQRRMLTMGTWLIPVIGALIALSHGTTSEPAPAAEELPEGGPAAPQILKRQGMPAFLLRKHLLNGQGFPILDWKQLADWGAQAATPEHEAAAIEMGREAWLLHLRDSFGDHAHLLATDTVWVLSSYSPKVASAAARFVATTRSRIASVLDGVAQFPAHNRSILVVFDDHEQYYRYVTNYYPEEGEFAFSGGMFVDHGCPHLLMVRDDLSVIEPVIAHEMTHSSLAYLSLPLWLDEGIAVTTEHQVSHSHRHPQEAIELMNKHADFWNAELMQEFWRGESFHRTDDGQALSYDMAQKIVGLIGREWSSFQRFVHGAKRDDAGAASARATLNLDLGQLAASAIGLKAEAGWSPNPTAWNSVATRATGIRQPG